MTSLQDASALRSTSAQALLLTSETFAPVFGGFMKDLGSADGVLLFVKHLKPVEDKYPNAVPAVNFEAAMDLCVAEIQATQRRMIEAGASDTMADIYARAVFDKLKSELGAYHGVSV